MKIVILGAGNLATHLSKALQLGGHKIVQIFSRTKSSSSTLGKSIKVPYTHDFNLIRDDADLYIYAISDDAIPELVERIFAPDAIHIHTAGSVNLDVFKNKNQIMVFLPLTKLFKRKEVDFLNIPIFIEANSQETEKTLIQIGQTISNQVYVLNSEQRLQMHIAAVFVSNFTNYLYKVAEQIIKPANISFEVLHPLIEETAQKIKFLSPYDAQTGPARRNDQKVIEKHLLALKNNPEYKDLYKLLSQMILEQYLH